MTPLLETRGLSKTFGGLKAVQNVDLSIGASDTRRADTKGRSIDHIGFEVKDLDAFCMLPMIAISGIRHITAGIANRRRYHAG